MKLYVFQTVPLSIIRSISLYTQQWYMSCRFGDGLWAGSGWNCSSILILLASCQQTCLTYTIAVCTVRYSWWWTEERSKTCRVSFQEYIWETGAFSRFYHKKFITMHGHMNVKYKRLSMSYSLTLQQNYRQLKAITNIFTCKRITLQ